MRIQPTNAATDSKGVGFGLEGNLFAPILVTVFLGVAILFFFFQTGVGADWPVEIRYGVSLAPTALTTIYILVFFNRRPPRYHHDFWEGVIFGGDFFVTRNMPPPHPVSGTKAALVKKA